MTGFREGTMVGFEFLAFMSLLAGLALPLPFSFFSHFPEVGLARLSHGWRLGLPYFRKMSCGLSCLLSAVCFPCTDEWPHSCCSIAGCCEDLGGV